MNKVANGFNSFFFINVGPNLAKTIEKHNDGAVQSGWKSLCFWEMSVKMKLYQR